MLYKNKILVISLFFILAIGGISAQDCTAYKTTKCDGLGSPYKYSGQSKSAYFLKGTTSRFSIIVYAGFDYNVRVCAEKKLKGLFFRIREDNATKSVLYDSSIEDIDYLEKQFSADKTQKIIIEVVIPEGDEKANLKNPGGCVGVLIEYKRSEKTGF